jgi:hypothetical protein
MPPPLAAMRAQFQSVLNDWGVSCDVLRLVATKNAAGKLSGAYASLVSGGVDETIWIQPVGGESNISNAGLNSETTHLAYYRFSGTALVAKDRILPSGSEFAFDVIRAYTRETHREAELKQVRRA